MDKTVPYGDIYSFTLELFTYFDEKRELFALIMGENGDISFLVSALRELRERQLERLKRNPEFEPNLSFDQALLSYEFIYLSGGILHVLTEWFIRDDGMSVETIADITAQFIESTSKVMSPE